MNPNCRISNVRIKPDVARKLRLGPVTRPALVKRIEATADLMRVAAVARAARAEQGRAQPQ